MTQQSTLSRWNIFAPLKFSGLFFICTTVISFLYMLIFKSFSHANIIPQTPLMTIIFICFIACAYHMFRRLPRTPLDKKSFITLHTSQTLIISTIFILTTLLLANNFNRIIYNLIMLESQSPVLFFCTIIISALIILYITGISLSNLYAKFWRVRAFNIPAWKIVCSMPFGFAGLWSAGYFLDTPNKKNHTVTAKTKWFSDLINKITKNTKTLIFAFVTTTLISGFFFGLSAVLLTLMLATIFGICTLNKDKQQFAKNISGKYCNAMIIINIVLITVFAVIFSTSSPTNTTSVTNSESITITDTNTGDAK